MTAERPSRVLAAAVTPLCDGGEQLDEAAFAPLMAFYERAGLDGVLVLGTTGEGILLTPAERRRAARLAVQAAAGLEVIVHCGAQTTAATCALAAHAAQEGAGGVAVIAPPYFALSPDELAAHLAAAAAACAPVPFYVYEFASRSGYAVAPEVIERLRERAGNLAGLKVSDSPWERLEPYLGLGLDVLVGTESLILPALERGAAGAISGIASAFPESVAALVRHGGEARAARVGALRDALSPGLQACAKAALGLRGVAVGPDVRRPLSPLAPSARARMSAELERILGPGWARG